jgi:hypothetical protein
VSALPPLDDSLSLSLFLESQKTAPRPTELDSDSDDGVKEAADRWNERVDTAFREMPLCVVFVSRLPRDALVEVEFIAIGKALGDICFDHPTRERACATVPLSYGHSQRTITMARIAQLAERPSLLSAASQLPSAKSLMLSMPIWECGYLSPSQQFPPVTQPILHSENEATIPALLPSLSSADASYSIDTHSTNAPSSFSVGYCQLSLSASSCAGSLLHICLALFQEIFDQIIETKRMAWQDLKTIKLFYPVSLCPFEDLCNASADALRLISAAHGATLPSSLVQIIPSSHRPQLKLRDGLTEPPLCVAQFFFVNFLQIKSELWIASRENR